MDTLLHGSGGNGCTARRHLFATCETVALVAHSGIKSNGIEPLKCIKAEVQLRGEGIFVVAAFVFVDFVVVEVGIHLGVVEGTGVVDARGEGDVERLAVESHIGTRREVDALIVLQVIAGIHLGIEVSAIHVDDMLPNGEAFPHREHLAIFIRLEAGTQRGSTLDALDIHQSGGEVAIFGRGDAAHYLYALDVVGGDGTHIDTTVGEVACCVGTVCGAGRDILHLGVTAEAHAIHHEEGAQRGDGVVAVVADSTCGGEVAGLAKGDAVDRSHIGVLRDITRQQFQDIGEAGRLNMLHGVTVYA